MNTARRTHKQRKPVTHARDQPHAPIASGQVVRFVPVLTNATRSQSRRRLQRLGTTTYEKRDLIRPRPDPQNAFRFEKPKTRLGTPDRPTLNAAILRQS